jgi:hypothetical protein
MSTNLGDDRAAERHWLPTTLVVVATVIAVVSAVTTWVHSQALDTDDWVEASSELIDDPEIQQALSNYLIGELYANVDVSAELEQVLPDALSGLAGPLSGALRKPATDGLEKVIASPQFGRVWADANRLAHQTFVAILRDETPPALSTSNGEVVLDLSTALENAASGLGLPGALVDRLPDDAGQIVIFSSSELADAQTTVRILDFLSWFTFILVVVLYALAVFLSRDRRHGVFIVGVGLFVAGIALLFLRAIGVRSTALLIVDDASNRDLAVIAGDVVTSLLRQSAWTGIIGGIFMMLAAALLGGQRWARATRRFAAPFVSSNAVVIAVGVLIVLALLWWSPAQSLQRPVTGIALLLLIIVTLIMFVARSRAEQASGALAAPPDDGEVGAMAAAGEPLSGAPADQPVSAAPAAGEGE